MPPRQTLPAGFTRSGGPYGRGNFTLRWRGATIRREIDAAVESALREEAAEVLADLQATLHVKTGEMNQGAFAEVGASGGKRSLAAGSTAEHTLYHELGTIYFEGHPQIRETMDRHIPHVTPRLRQKIGVIP